MSDNIIEFKKKEDELPPEEAGQLLVNMRIYDDGSLNVWVSHAIEDVDQIDWVKEMAFNAMVTLGQHLDEVDDRYVEHTVGEKDVDDLDD